MSAPAPRPGLGFGGAVGLGIAAVILIGALAIGHAVLGQLEGAARVIVTFAEIMLCVLLGALTLAILGALAYGGQLARLHLAGRRAEVTGRPVMRAEVIADDAEARPMLSEGSTSGNASLPSSADKSRAIQAKHGVGVLGQRHLRVLPDAENEGGEWT